MRVHDALSLARYLRLVFMNPDTTRDDVKRLAAQLLKFAADMDDSGAAPTGQEGSPTSAGRR
jgi:hypothetical protein